MVLSNLLQHFFVGEWGIKVDISVKLTYRLLPLYINDMSGGVKLAAFAPNPCDPKDDENICFVDMVATVKREGYVPRPVQCVELLPLRIGARKPP